MAIGYTEIDFLNGSAPALNATNLNKMDEAIKDACDLLDAETAAGRAIVEATNAVAQRSALGLGDSATLNVGTGAGDVAAGNAPAGAVTTHESAYTHANIPTAAGKTAADGIGAAGIVGVASTGVEAATKVPKATGAELAALLTAGGYSLSPATGSDNLDNIADGTSYKRVTAAEKTALTAGYSALAAGYTHLQRLAEAEATKTLFDYNKAYKTPENLLREIVEAASCGAATVVVDDLGFPSMMFVARGPILAGHIHADMGATTALRSAVIAAAGLGYTAGDILTIAGGTGGTVRVLTVDGSGAVTSIEIANPGSGYSAATGAATTGGTGSGCTITITIGPIHPAYSVAGVAKTQLLIGMFKGTSFNGSTYHGSGTGWRSVCWPGLMPTGSLTFDQAKALHTNKGAGWHLMSMWERGLFVHMPMKMGTEPRGNSYYGRTHESGYEYECAVRSDGLEPGTASGTAKHRNGSGPTSWAHNKERWGIHDLSGGMSEWVDGFKIVDGQIFMPNDNNFNLAEGSWPAQGVFFDNSVAGSGGAPRLSNALVNALTDPNYTTVTHNALTLTAGFDGLDLAKRQRMLLASIAPKIASGGVNPWSPKGTLYLRNYGERLPLVGGSWNGDSSAGLAVLYLSNLRSVVVNSLGFRPAFISP